MFGTSGVRGPLEVVSPSLVLRLGRSLGRLPDRVVVGRDGRLTGNALRSSIVAGVESAGAEAVCVGEVPTYVLAWAAREYDAYGAMLTASHNPPDENGVKVFAPDGIEAGSDVESRLENGLGSDEADWDDWTRPREAEVADDYVSDAVEYVGSELGLRVAVDCGNGVGSHTTLPLLERLGCDVVGVNAQVDGAFPGRPSKPESSTLGDFTRFVERRDFDVAFAHDGDADRAVVVTPDGELVPEDAVVALLARESVQDSSLSEPVVITTPNASSRIDSMVEDAGGSVERVALGGIPDAIRGRDDVVFAAEPWKHMFLDFGGWVDGSVTAAEVSRLVDESGGLDELLDDVGDISVRKTSVGCPDDEKEEVMDRVADVLAERFDADVDTSYGVRLDFGDGRWALVRPSGTEPLIRVYTEDGTELFERVVESVREQVGW